MIKNEMILIVKPQVEDAEGINDVIKRSWYKTYVNSEIGVTQKDFDLMYSQNEKRQIEVFRNRAQNQTDDDISLVAKEGNDVLGFIRVKIDTEHTELLSLYVDPDYTGQGIGTNLWQEIQKFIPQNKRVIVEVAQKTKSVEFYKKIGFVATGEVYFDNVPMPSSGIRLSIIKMVYNRNMNLNSTKILSLILGITSLVFVRLMFFFFNDPEGPNLLIVVVTAFVVWLLSVATYTLNFSGVRRFLLAISVQIVIVVGLYMCMGLIPPIEITQQYPMDYKNATYMIDGRAVTLKNGMVESEIVPGSASKLVTKYFGNELATDLNDDGRNDVVFLVTQTGGGSGTFYYVVSALNTPKGYVGSDGYLLGDRISPQTTGLSQNPRHKHVIVVNYADRKPNESMVTPPSIGKSVYLKLDIPTMQWGIVDPNFEGESR